LRSQDSIDATRSVGQSAYLSAKIKQIARPAESARELDHQAGQCSAT